MSTALWVDATHGAAGDMLLGALLDAGADLDAVGAALTALGTEPVSVRAESVRRHGLRATRAVVRAAASAARRGPTEIADLLTAAALPASPDAFSREVFDRLAFAEARVHGVDVAEIHFHEVGALDSLADVVGCAVALDSLGLLGAGVIRRVSTVALGGGTVATEHGRLPVPVPATLELLSRAGAPVGAGPGDRELCTPTGAALLATLATDWGPLPDLVVRAYGSGAGTADPPDRPNLLRVVIGEAPAAAAAGWREDELRIVDASVDDLDPRLWPGVLDDLVAAGAVDAWLTPVLMRKGRPGHVVTAMTPPGAMDAVFRSLVTTTTTLGVRVHGVARRALPRDSVEVAVEGRIVSVKRGFLDGSVTTVQPEFDDVRAAAQALGVPIAEVLRRVLLALPDETASVSGGALRQSRVPGTEHRLALDPDRLLPADPQERAIARSIYEAVRELALICPHGHVDPKVLLDDQAFPDPATLLLTPDHYVTRLLHADGVALDPLGVGQGRLTDDAARHAWRLLCEHWPVFRGTPVRYWLDAELVDIFGVDTVPSADSADAIYDQISASLAEPAFRPRALFERFGISVLATTDDPCSDLSAHRALGDDPTWTGRVIPTFRPDAYLEPAGAGWADAVVRLAVASGVDTGDYAGYVQALEQRRRYFVANGAVSADHSHPDVRTDPLEPAEAERIYRAALVGQASVDEATAFRRHMLCEMARMSCDDGLVMTLHPGVRRNHHTPTFERYGADVGADIPIQVEFTDALRPLLQRFGTVAGFHLVAFTLDETVWSRELAPLAGFYPSVYVGVPWWFLDAPDAIRRFRAAVTETAGFTRTSGFVDDTRAFCSIPARHDMSRRVEAGFLARLVAEHRLTEDEAVDTAVALVSRQPEAVFKL